MTLSTRLRDGTLVLAKLYHGKPSALTFANRTQAERAAARVSGHSGAGTGLVIHRGRPFYVAVYDAATTQGGRR